MKPENRERKNEIKAINAIQLCEEQKEAKRLIIDNQVVIITGNAGTGKTIVAANTCLDFLAKKQISKIYCTRALVEVGKSMGFLPGMASEKLNPYLVPFLDNLSKCSNPKFTADLVESKKVEGLAISFIRGITIDDILVVEEAANTTKHEMLAILTRLGKNGKIVIVGDLFQCDTRDPNNGLAYVIEISKLIEEIKHIKLKSNHRSDLVAKILNYEYNK